MTTTPQPTSTAAPVSPETFTATLQFPTRDAAQTFATQWSRATLRGYTLSPDGTVTLDRVTPTEKTWIDAYITAANPDPVSPPRKPYAYAIKTPSGYLATQGRERWFESEPSGWALYSEPPTGLAGTIPDAEIVPIFR